MFIMRALVTAGLAVALSLAPSPARAQCFSTRVFASIGGGASTDKLRIDPNGAQNLGNEIGLFWSSAHSGFGNNFAGGCPSSDAGQPGGGWWKTTQGGLRGIEGVLGTGGCLASSCPSGDLTVVVQDQSPAGNDAFFIALRVDSTPAQIRWWDLARVDPSPSPSVLPLQPFPALTLRAVAYQGGGSFLLELELADVAANVHAVQGSGDLPLPASSVVARYDLYRHVGTADPGRDASAWTLDQQHPYADSHAVVHAIATCVEPGSDVFFALGVSFDGGAGADVASRYVGAALRIECQSPGAPTPAGVVPDGHHIPGAPLTMAKAGDGDITLSWGATACSDLDFAIYEGVLGDFESHARRVCSTNLAHELTLEPAAGSAYYLVVPISYEFVPVFQPSREGSYGRRSDGSERPQGSPGCLPQWFVPCS